MVKPQYSLNTMGAYDGKPHRVKPKGPVLAGCITPKKIINLGLTRKWVIKSGANRGG